MFHGAISSAVVAVAVVIAGLVPVLASSSDRNGVADFNEVDCPAIRPSMHSGAVAWVDYDHDSWPDLFVAGNAAFGSPKLFLNDRNGCFVADSSTLLFNLNLASGVWGDYDNDGDVDLYVVRGGADLLLANVDGVLVDATCGPLGDPGSGVAAAWADYDGDLRLDIYVANSDIASFPDHLYQNDRHGCFLDGTCGQLGDDGNHGVAWGDYDNDGDPDLYLAGGQNLDKLYRNEGVGCFTDATHLFPEVPLSSHCPTWADYDNDGDLDLFLGDQQRLRLFENTGAAFIAADACNSKEFEGFVTNVCAGDYDNDGFLDIFMTSFTSSSRLLRGTAIGCFEDVTPSVILADSLANSTGCAWGDYDRDGDLDIYVASAGSEMNRLFRNENPAGNHWLQLQLVGRYSNGTAIGARVRVVTEAGSQMRDVSGGASIGCQDSPFVEFGLGTQTSVDTLWVAWPSKLVSIYTNVSVDTMLVLVEPESAGAPMQQPASSLFLEVVPNPMQIGSEIGLQLDRPGPVRLAVYDAAGRMRGLLLDADARAGLTRLRWEGKDTEGRPLSAGIYTVRLAMGNRSESRTVVYLPR